MYMYSMKVYMLNHIDMVNYNNSQPTDYSSHQYNQKYIDMYMYLMQH